MRIFTEQALKEFAERNPSSKTALQVWCKIVKKQSGIAYRMSRLHLTM